MSEVILKPWIRTIPAITLLDRINVDAGRLIYGSANIQCSYLEIESRDSTVNPGEKIEVGKMEIAIFFNFRHLEAQAQITQTLESNGVTGIQVKDSVVEREFEGSEGVNTSKLMHKFTPFKSYEKRIVVKTVKAYMGLPLKAMYRLLIDERGLSVKSVLAKNGAKEDWTTGSDLLKIVGKSGELRRARKAIDDFIEKDLGEGFSIGALEPVRVTKIFGEDQHGEPYFGKMRWSQKSGFLKKKTVTTYSNHDPIESDSIVLCIVAETDRTLLTRDIKTAGEELRNAIESERLYQVDEFTEPLGINDILYKKDGGEYKHGGFGGGDPALY